MFPKNLDKLCKQLGYRFNDLGLLKQALTHRSYSAANNERLEFLGDAILSFVIADYLLEQFQEKSEGELSRLRAYLVKGDTLSELALKLNLGDYLYLGQGELKSGGYRRASILADTFEALIAAIYLDGGLTQCQQVIRQLFEQYFDKNTLNEALIDAKTALQEWLQAHKMPLPVYALIKTEGLDPHQIFYVQCSVLALGKQTSGVGSTRRKAEQEAAQLLLQALKTDA